MTVEANLLSPDILIIAGIIVLIFGGSKIPELAKGLGQSMKEFKKAVREDAPEAESGEESKKG